MAQPRLPRVVSMLQMAGTVVGIPVALASGYSVYHANFSTEAVCQGLRASIVSMLDKSADAATLRALVRRDVMAFEQNCRSVDPDAVAAFNSLLTVVPAVAAVPAPPPPPKTGAKSEPKTEARPEPRSAAREAEPRREIAKQAPAAKAPAEKPAIARDASLPDDKWIEAVRGALVTHDRPPAEIELGAPPRPLAPRAAPPPAEAAPVLPPPVAVAAPPTPPADADHPVPPAAIPDPASAMDAPAQNEPRGPSRFGAIMSHIPVLNRVWGEEHHED